MNGFVLFEGGSLIDGEPIVVVATLKSANRKTGNMIQTWIIRSDCDPVTALRQGKDRSICGDCRHRGDGTGANRSCYVDLTRQGPAQVYKSYRKGLYPTVSQAEMQQFVTNRKVRFGAYGDPAAVAFELWESIAKQASGWTGYTHQWRTCDRRFNQLVMASADSPQDRELANQLGYRTFRVRRNDELLMTGEVNCPATKEGGNKSTCISCNLCNGTMFERRTVERIRSVSLTVHGIGAGNF
jgi:hypothetical protein